MFRRFLLATGAVVLFAALLAPFSAAAVPVTARQITITDPLADKLTFDALTAGDPAAARRGKLVLLLHGFPQNAETWRPMLPAIAEAGYYAVAPSLRGYSPGARPMAAGSYDTANSVRDVLAIADALRAPRFHVVGHDWGGIVAWRTAAENPTRVRSLTSVSTTNPSALFEAALDLSTGQLGRLVYFLFMQEPSMRDLMSAFDGYFAVATLKEMGLTDQQARGYMGHLLRNGSLESALRWYRDNPLTSQPQLPTITVPTTLVWGRNDFAFGPESAALSAKYVKADYRFVPVDAGHFVPETHFGLVTTEILRRLGSTGS